MTFTRYLNPKNDIAFKRIFGTEKNKDILLDFLNDVLGKDESDRIIDIRFLNPTLEPMILVEKRSIVDVLCTDQDGKRYIVEMQVANIRGFEKRAQYYAARAYCNQFKTGEEYHDLKEIIFLAITNFVMFPDKHAYLSRHVILDQDSLEHNLKDFSFTFIELPKFNKPIESLNTKADKWCYFFKHAAEPDSIEHLIEKQDPVINKAYQELLAIHWNDEELAQYEAMDKIIRDNRARESYLQNEKEKAKREGIEEGIEKGREEGEKQKSIEIATRLLASGQTDLNFIAQITELSVAEIQSLLSV